MLDLAKLKTQINRTLKEDLVILASDLLISDVKGHIPTGWTLLDEAFGGGLPMGRTIELYGEQGVGKSSLMYHAAAHCQNMNGVVVLFDPESTFPRELARTMGVDPERVLIMDPRLTLEKVFGRIMKMARLIHEEAEDAPILFIWDTIAATPSEDEVNSFGEGEAFSRGVNPHRAQIIKAGFRACTLVLAETSSTLVVVNHVYDGMGGGPHHGPPNQTPGGRGIKYHASVRINMWTGMALKEKGDKGEQIGVKVTAKVEKNKLGSPKKKVYSYFYYGIGFNDQEALWDYLTESGAIARAGSWYTVPLPDGESQRILGSGKFGELLAATPGLYEHLQEQARQVYRKTYHVTEEEET